VTGGQTDALAIFSNKASSGTDLIEPLWTYAEMFKLQGANCQFSIGLCS
jgi:hypothetical protein